ncbi:MAG: hypothetical protein HY862_00845 [Chloroflexi bacterium]|nr:hypothetical protein [Chloroflexota bacterium]
MIIRRKPTGVLIRRRPIGSLGQRLLQRSVAQVRRMVISRLPQRNLDTWESQPMVWNRDFMPEEPDFEAESQDYLPEPTPEWSTPKAPPRRPSPAPSLQAKEEDAMPRDLQAIYNMHKAMGHVTGESFLHRDAEPDSQKITKTPPSAKPVQASGRYEPPPQRPVMPRNPQPTPESVEPEPPPVQRRVMSKVEYLGTRNMAEELGLTETSSETGDDFEDDSFEEDMPDALPGSFEDADENPSYNEAVSAAIAKAEAPTSHSASASVQASPADFLEDDPQKFTQTLIEQQPVAPAGEQQAAQSSPNQANQSSQSTPQSSQADSPSQAAPTSQAGQPVQSAASPDQMFMGAAPSVIEESENIQRKPADVAEPTDFAQNDEVRPYTPDQLSAAIAQAEAPAQNAEPQVVRAKRIETPEPTIQSMVQPVFHTRIVDEVEDQPRNALPEVDAPTFERRATGQPLVGGEDFSPRVVETRDYTAPAITPPSVPAVAPAGRVARMPEITEVPEIDMPPVRRQSIPLDEAFDTSLPKQSVSLDEALLNTGAFTESPIQEAPTPILMPPIGKTRYRDIPLNPPSPEAARPPATPSVSASASPVQRSVAPDAVAAAVQRAEAPAPEASNTQTEQGLLSLLDLPEDTPIQRDGPPMPNVEVTPSVQTAAIQRETSASPAVATGAPESSDDGEGANKAEVDKMANEVYRLLQRRLKVERERRSR